MLCSPCTRCRTIRWLSQNLILKGLTGSIRSCHCEMGGLLKFSRSKMSRKIEITSSAGAHHLLPCTICCFSYVNFETVRVVRQRVVGQRMHGAGLALVVWVFELSQNFTSTKLQKTPYSWLANQVLSWGNNFFFKYISVKILRIQRSFRSWLNGKTRLLSELFIFI